MQNKTENTGPDKGRPIYLAKCCRCDKTFETKPGIINAKFIGENTYFKWLPECPECGNYDGNQLFHTDGQLTLPLRRI